MPTTPVLPFSFFISYNWDSRDYAEYTFYTAVINGLKPWVDFADLRVGDDLKRAMYDGIQASNGYLLFATKKALKSKNVKYEYTEALNKFQRDPNFKIIIFKVTKGKLPKNLRPFIYQNFERENWESAIAKVIEQRTSKPFIQAFTKIAYQRAANRGGLDPNERSNRDLAHEAVEFSVRHVKHFLHQLALHGNPLHTPDSIMKLLQTHLFENSIELPPGWIPLGNGIFEFLLHRRMRIPPRVTFIGLPPQLGFRIVHESEIHVRIQVVHKVDAQPYLNPFPFNAVTEFDSEL